MRTAAAVSCTSNTSIHAFSHVQLSHFLQSDLSTLSDKISLRMRDEPTPNDAQEESQQQRADCQRAERAERARKRQRTANPGSSGHVHAAAGSSKAVSEDEARQSAAVAFAAAKPAEPKLSELLQCMPRDLLCDLANAHSCLRAVRAAESGEVQLLPTRESTAGASRACCSLSNLAPMLRPYAAPALEKCYTVGLSLSDDEVSNAMQILPHMQSVRVWCGAQRPRPRLTMAAPRRVHASPEARRMQALCAQLSRMTQLRLLALSVQEADVEQVLGCLKHTAQLAHLAIDTAQPAGEDNQEPSLPERESDRQICWLPRLAALTHLRSFTLMMRCSTPPRVLSLMAGLATVCGSLCQLQTLQLTAFHSSLGLADHLAARRALSQEARKSSGLLHAIQQLTQLSCLRLTGTCFIAEDDAREALADALAACTLLQSVSFGKGLIMSVRALQSALLPLTNLTHLELARCAVEAEPGAELPFSRNLCKLELRSVKHRNEADPEAFAQSLLAFMSSTSALQEVQLFSSSVFNVWQQSDANAFTAITQLTHLTIAVQSCEEAQDTSSWQRICSWLGPWVGSLTRLRHLRLVDLTEMYGDDFRDEWVGLVAQLAQATALTELDLSLNALPVHFAEAACEAFTALTSLQKLHTAAWSGCDSLRDVDISDYLWDIHNFIVANSVKESDAVQRYNVHGSCAVAYLLKFAEALGPKLLALDARLCNDLRRWSDMPVDDVCAGNVSLSVR